MLKRELFAFVAGFAAAVAAAVAVDEVLNDDRPPQDGQTFDQQDPTRPRTGGIWETGGYA